MATRSLLAELVLRVRDEGAAVIERTRAGLAGIGNAASAALEPLQSFWALIGAAVSVGGAKALIDRADAFTNLSNQVKVASKDEADYQASMQSVAAVAKDANANLDSTARLYGKVKQSADSLGISQQQVADVTSVVAKGMQLSGAEAGAAAGATLQFTQALGSGVLRGDEFNSVLEASPALIKAIADGLGVTVGEMRGLAEAGQLTSDRVVQALLSQKQAIDETYAKLPQTVAQATEQFDNAATLFVGRLNEQLGATHSLTDGLKFLATNLDAVAALMGAAFAASVAKGAQSTAQFVTASIAARDAARQQAIAAEQQQAANLGAAQSNVAAAQAAYNRALAEQRATAAQLAALESLAGLFASEEALAAARTQATAAANAAAAATQRYAAAQAALNAAQGPAAASVGLFGRAMGLLAGPAGLILTAVSAFGLLYAAFSKQKTATDELSGSTDQYAAALDKLNRAQLEAASLKIGDAMRDQRQAIADAAAEVERLQNQHVGLWEALTESKSRAQLLTEAEGAQADAVAKLSDLEAKHEALLVRLAGVKQEALAIDLSQVTAYNQLITALDKVGKTLQDREKYLKQVSDAEIAETQALLDKARATNDANEVERLTIELAKQRADAAKQAAGLAQAEVNAEQAKIATLEKLRDVQGQLTPGQQKSLALAQESAVAKQAEAEAAQALADKLALVASSEESGSAAKQRAAEKARQLADASSDYLSSLEAVANAEIAGLRAEIDLANAKGETATAVGKSVQLAALEAKWAQTLADAKQAELAAEKASTEAKIAELQATNSNTDATQKQIAALQLNLVALGKQAEAEQIAAQAKALAAQQTQQNTEATEHHTVAAERDAAATQKQAASFTLMEDSAVGALRELSGLSAGMNALISSMLRVNDIGESFGHNFRGELGQLRLQMEQVNQAIEHNRNIIGPYFDAFERNVDIANQARKAYLEQAIAATELAGRLKDASDGANTNTNALRNLVSEAEHSINGMELLNQQTLSRLQSEIDAANKKLQQMQQEAEDARATIARLNAEIAAEQGDTEKAALLKQQLDYQQALAEIEAKRNQAELEGNRELVALYDEQARKLTELNALKEKNIKADAESARQQAANNTTSTAELPGGTGAAALPSSSGTSARTYNLNLTGVNGRTLPATTTTDPTSFLDEIERAQARSLR